VIHNRKGRPQFSWEEISMGSHRKAMACGVIIALENII